MTYLPLFTCIVAFIFAVTVLDQYFARRKSFQLLWAIGLFIYSAAALNEYFWYGLSHAAVFYRLYYLLGICSPAVLGMGTLYLLMRRSTANWIMTVVGVISAYMLVRCLTASIATPTDLTVKGIMPVDAVIIAILFGSFGAFVLVGGAVWSAWIFWRKRILSHRVVSNVLIAIGALFPSFGGSLLRLMNAVNVNLILELIGVIIIFFGFLRTKEVFGFFRFPLIHGFKRLEEKPAGQ